MAGAFEHADITAPSLLPVYKTDVEEMVDRAGIWRRVGRRGFKRDGVSTPSRFQSSIGAGWLRKAYGLVRKLVGPRTRSRDPDQDVEAATTDQTGPTGDSVLQPTGFTSDFPHRLHGKDKHPAVHEAQSRRNAADPNDQLPARHGPPTLPNMPALTPHLLSDEENARMNRKIDKLIAAIDDRRPIHFVPDAATGEVQVFADHEVNLDKGDKLEPDMAASPENFGRIIRHDNGVGPTRSVSSLRYAGSSDSWITTDLARSSSNAWERTVAAANVRFALAHGQMDRVTSVVRRPFRGSRMGLGVRRDRRSVRTVSPIPLAYDKPLRMSTPSIHSDGSEQDASSPLFAKSCERILRETYAKPPESTFQRESSPDHSQMDEWVFISEPRDMPSPEARGLKEASGKERAFGVFNDGSIAESPGKSPWKKTEKSALRSKVLKDISNLRRPAYLQFNSFAKGKNSLGNRASTAVPATASLTGFGGAPDPSSRRAYINKRWPGLLEDRSNGKMVGQSRLDGAARRRNEQAVGSPINASLYSLSHARTSVADSSLNVNPTRQAHFDLALARLEGRALPPPPSPISRHPDWAALYDLDVQIEGGHRPLSLCGPAPNRPVNPTRRWVLWRYSE